MEINLNFHHFEPDDCVRNFRFRLIKTYSNQHFSEGSSGVVCSMWLKTIKINFK